MVDSGEIGGSVAGPDPSFVMVESHVHDPMQAVFDAPMVADGGGEPLRRQGRGRNVEAPLLFGLGGGFAHAFDHGQRGQPCPVMTLAEPIDVVHDGYGAGFDAAMVAIHGFCPGHRGILKTVGDLLIGEDLGVLAQATLVALQGEDVVGLFVDDFAGDVALAPSSGHSIRLRLTEPLASLAHRVDGDDSPFDVQQFQ